MKKVIIAVTVMMVILAGCSQFPVKEGTIDNAVSPEALDAFKGDKQVPFDVITGMDVGVKDWDKDGVDDGVEVLVQPISAEAKILKRPGSVTFNLYEKDFNKLGNQGKLFWMWSFPAVEVMKKWEGGLFGGYRFKLKWDDKMPPATFLVLETIFYDISGEKFMTVDRALKINYR